MIDMIRRLLQNKGRATTPKRRSTVGRRRIVLKGRTACGVIATAMLLTTMLGSCIADHEFSPTPPAGDREVAFTVSVPGMKAPSTRALDSTKEQEIAEIDVVIFNTSGELVEYHRTTDIKEIVVTPESSDWQFSVGGIENGSNITVTFIANASREVLRALRALEDASSNGSYIGAHKTEFLKELYSTNEGKWNTSDNGYWKIPMYGEENFASNESIYDNPTLNTPLTRMLAKVDVMNGKHPKNNTPSAGDFRLTKIHVVHYNACGTVAPTWHSGTGAIQPGPSVAPNIPTDPRKVVWTTDGDELTYNLATDQDQLMSEIYLFECQAQSKLSPGASNPEKQTRLVFEGYYYTSATEYEKYFYPVDFNEENGKTYIPLLRNNRYHFTITGVTGRGHDYLGEAVAAMGVMSNLKTSLLVVDESGIRNIVWNGEYFLGIENDEVILDETANSMVTLKCLTNYAEGWELNKSLHTDGIEYIDGNNWLNATLTSPSNSTSKLELKALTYNNSDVRKAIVHIRAGRLTHEITVEQRSGSIAPRFARSNVVWDAANNKLTFATTEAANGAIPANVQGVFFKWGSLVAISPTGTSAAYNANQILFSANGTTNYTWANIPYINETGAPFNDSDVTSDDFAGYNGGTNVGGPGYSASANKGDICRYITAQGWVPSGERWRLPKQSELDALMAEASVSNNGGFGSVTISPNIPANVNGFWQVPSGRWLGGGASRGTEQVPGGYSVYFPAGGYRIFSSGDTDNADNLGYSWSGSSNLTTGAYYPYVDSSGAGRGNDSRYYGFPVRCIRE